jgi:phosphoribosylformimino-5-aminoimidazole carboxamide ribotide isomerase
MELYPAIDLVEGRCVRLYRGDYDRETVYGDDPVAQARAFAEAGAPWIHVVDLDAARTGSPDNRPVVAAIAAGVDVPVQTGGGVRDLDSARALHDLGVARIVMGTAALADPDLVAEIASAQAVAVGLDVRGREVAVRGWTEGSGHDVLDVARWFEDAGVSALVVTQISQDGTLDGPDLAGLELVLADSTLPVIASGGVGTLDDLRDLAALRGGDRHLDGAIVGRALYERKFTLEAALDAIAG